MSKINWKLKFSYEEKGNLTFEILPVAITDKTTTDRGDVDQEYVPLTKYSPGIDS